MLKKNYFHYDYDIFMILFNSKTCVYRWVFLFSTLLTQYVWLDMFSLLFVQIPLMDDNFCSKFIT